MKKMKCHFWTLGFFIALQLIECRKSQNVPTSDDTRTLDRQSSQMHFSDIMISDTKLEVKSTQNSPKFTPWSKWSDCNEINCTQTRRRKCVIKRKCGDTVQTEEKRCKFGKRNGRKRVKCGRNHRNKNTEVDANVSFSIYSESDDDLIDKRRYRFKIVPTQKETLEKKILPSKSSKWYSKWTRWSSCTRNCVTHRKRWCKRPKLCSHEVIKEVAYCYVEGTFCQRWISKKIQKNKNDPNGEFFVDTVIEELPNKDRNDVESSNVVYHSAHQQQCGILYSGRNTTLKKSPWSMTRIIGGRQAPKGKWSWQVAILNKYKVAFCGGTLVASQWVLTAAHCIRRRLYVRIGEHSLTNQDDTEIELKIIQTIVHPEYDPDTVDNDVALLKLPPFDHYLLSNKQPGVACLPKQRQALPVHRLCTIIGWGKRRSSDPYGSDVLHEAQVPIVSTDICKNTYIDYYITSNMFCAGYQKGHMDSCAGDSGGPLLCKDPSKPFQPWTIFGITSFGDGCGKRGKYGIYTKVPNYVRWINRVLQIENLSVGTKV